MEMHFLLILNSIENNFSSWKSQTFPSNQLTARESKSNFLKFAMRIFSVRSFNLSYFSTSYKLRQPPSLGFGIIYLLKGNSVDRTANGILNENLFLTESKKITEYFSICRDELFDRFRIPIPKTLNSVGVKKKSEKNQCVLKLRIILFLHPFFRQLIFFKYNIL